MTHAIRGRRLSGIDRKLNVNHLFLKVIALENLLNLAFRKSVIIDTHVIHVPAVVGVVIVAPPAELESLTVAGTDLGSGPIGNQVSVDENRYVRPIVKVSEVNPVSANVRTMVGSRVPTPVLTEQLSVTTILDVPNTPILVQAVGTVGISVTVKSGLTPRVVIIGFGPKANRSGIFSVNPEKFSGRLSRNIPIRSIEAESSTKPTGRPSSTRDQTSVKTPQGVPSHDSIAFIHRPIGDQIRGTSLN